MADPVPTLIYTDQVLSPLVTVAIETAAMAEIDALATFPAPWRDRLVILRVYLALCLEYASESDDPFSVKLGQYRVEYDGVLADARAAVAKAAMTTGLFSIAMERA
jgi:hypothetical protein